MYLKIHFKRRESGDVEVAIHCNNPGDFPHANIFPSPILIDPNEWESLNGGWAFTGKTFALRVEAEAYAVKVIDRVRKLYADWSGIFVVGDYGVVIE